MKCKCDKCGKVTEGKMYTKDGLRLLVLCPECKEKHKMFVADLAKRLGITVRTEERE